MKADSNSKFLGWHLPRASALFAMLVVLSFCVHDIQLNHSHQHEPSGGHEDSSHLVPALSEFLHAADKKLLFALLLVSIALGAGILAHAFETPKTPQRVGVDIRQIRERHDEHVQLFRSGILHPKLCG